jgi:hypothetical protein
MQETVMSDYLASLAARSINQNRGVRFLRGELRPRLASRFEPPFVGAAPLVEEGIEQESIAPEVPSTSPLTHLFYPPDREGRPTTANQPVLPIDSTAGDVSEPPAVETPAPLARAIEGMRPIPAGQNRAVRQVTRYHEENETLPTKSHSSLSLSPQSQSVSVAMPMSQSDTWSQQRRSLKTTETLRETTLSVPNAMRQETIIERVSDRARSFRVEPQQVGRGGRMQQPIREQTDSSLSQRLSVTNAETQPEIAVANRSVSLHTPAPDQNRGLLQSVLARLSEPRYEAEPSAAPTVNVTIDRIEVRAKPPPPASTPKPRSTPVMTLEEYLQRRATGGGS